RGGVQALRQILGDDCDRPGEAFLVVDHDVQVGCPAAADGSAARTRVLGVDHRGVKVGHRLADRQHVLIPRAATPITVLHQHLVLLLAVRLTTPEQSRLLPENAPVATPKSSSSAMRASFSSKTTR